MLVIIFSKKKKINWGKKKHFEYGPRYTHTSSKACYCMSLDLQCFLKQNKKFTFKIKSQES